MLSTKTFLSPYFLPVCRFQVSMLTRFYNTQNWHITCTEKRQQHNDGSKTIAEIFKAYVHYEMMSEIYNVWNTNWEVSFRKMRSC